MAEDPLILLGSALLDPESQFLSAVQPSLGGCLEVNINTDFMCIMLASLKWNPTCKPNL